MLNGSMDLFHTAEDKFGKLRADDMRDEIEQLESEIDKLRSAPLTIDDEP
jgi:hypothetical protein